ncbi:MAG: thiamine transport system ATP-binding protein [Chloroflexota bacterium]|jgi:thiamine transport system ATP-binding protein|nr:thiamine transport system ATP-binding protein [Chloroflexota bacterium]
MLSIHDVRVAYGTTMALDGVSLEIGAAERLAVLGPSGSGKSTLLRAIAGLEPLTAGRIEWAGADVAGVPVHRRNFGLMFQDYALFPHRDVARNVAFGLETRDMPAAERRRRVDEVLALVGLPGYGARRIDQLSGGEQQRVALARALAPMPRLLMLDEPLGALDRALRTHLLDELTGLFARLGLPLIYVTHDQEEALAMGDRVAVLNQGRLETVMPARDLWRAPPNEFVARFLGLTNVIPIEPDDGSLRTPWGDLPTPDSRPGGATRFLIRPEAVALDPEGPLSGVVRAVVFRGDTTTILVAPADGDGPQLEAHVRTAAGAPPSIGESVSLRVDPSGVLFLP